MQIPVSALTVDAFAAYGEAFPPPNRVEGRLDAVARLQNGRPHARPNLFMVRTGTASLPHRFTKMESHPHSSQSFVPLEGCTILLGVARPGLDGQPDLTTLRGFVARNIGFSYNAGIWHLPLATLEGGAAVLGFMYEDGTPEDCVWADVEPSTLVER